MLYKFRNRSPEIGKDTYVSEHALVIGNVKIGDNCYIGHGAIVRGDYGRIEIGSGTAVEEGVIVHAPPEDSCLIGQRVTIGHGAIIHGKSIGDYVFIEMGAIISVDSEIGEHSIIAEGTLIKMRQKIHPGVMVGGNPAKELRKITDEDKKRGDWATHLYIDLAKEYLCDGMPKVE